MNLIEQPWLDQPTINRLQSYITAEMPRQRMAHLERVSTETMRRWLANLGAPPATYNRRTPTTIPRVTTCHCGRAMRGGSRQCRVCWNRRHLPPPTP